MTDLITAEDAKKLLDGSTPGPWEWTTGRFSNNPYLSPNILLLAFDGGGPDGVDPNDAANARLIAAAPDLARTVIALHAQLADAQAAQAMVVERCAEGADFAKRRLEAIADEGWNGDARDFKRSIPGVFAELDAIRDLAPIDGLALVQELRAERDAASSVAAAAYGATLDWEQILEDDALWQAQDDIAKSRVACMTAEADRDRLAAANAALEAKVAGLVEALKLARECFNGVLGAEMQDTERRDQGLDLLDAALATQEAGNA